MDSGKHQHQHSPNRFAVIPTPVRLNADQDYAGSGVTIAMLDSGFSAHPDLLQPANRIVAYHDLAGEKLQLESDDLPETWQWHGTQTAVVAAGSGHLSDGFYRGLAHQSQLVLLKVSEQDRITEDNIARGIDWVIDHREQFNIRILNISLGGDEDVPCSRSIIDQAAERAVAAGIVVIVAAGNSTEKRPIPPANSPSVITVGGYNDNNALGLERELYHSSFGVTADGTVKPEIIAPAMWVAAPILPGTTDYNVAQALSAVIAAPDYELPLLLQKYAADLQLPASWENSSVAALRSYFEERLNRLRVVAAHYQHVDGTSFAAPIISSVAAQMLEANPNLTPEAIKSILVSTSDRILGQPAMRQGYGVVHAARAIALAKAEQHYFQTLKFGPPRIVDGCLLFVYHDDTAAHVSVATDFNEWDSTPLEQDNTGLWTARFKAPSAGTYQYKFVVNGHRWIEDPSNGLKAPDNHGGLNSLLVIG